MHTPTPWRVLTPRRDIRTMFGGDTGLEILAILYNDDGSIGGYQTVIGHVNCQHDKRILSAEDAEFIVRACNAHDDLLTALETLSAALVDQTADDALASFEDNLADYKTAGLSEKEYRRGIATHVIEYIKQDGKWDNAIDVLSKSRR